MLQGTAIAAFVTPIHEFNKVPRFNDELRDLKHLLHVDREHALFVYV